MTDPRFPRDAILAEDKVPGTESAYKEEWLDSFAEAVSTTATAEQTGADETKLYRHTVHVKQRETGWWICDDEGPIEGPFGSQDSVIAAVEST